MAKVTLRSGISLHYQRIGEGPDLVLIHGLSGNLAVWHLKMVPILRDHYRVLTYDLRGHGYSDYPPTGYSVEDMANDLTDLLDELGIDRAPLIGHSYGADTALYQALKRPERVPRVIAVEAGIPALIHVRRRDEWEGWQYWVSVLEQFGHEVPADKRSDIDYLLRLSLTVPKQHGPAIGRTRKAEPILRLLQTTMVQDYESVGDLTLDNIATIQTPVTLIYGFGSAFMGTYDFLRHQLPNATGLVLPPTNWGGHFGVLEQPELLVKCMLSYLQGTPLPPMVSPVPTAEPNGEKPEETITR
jgi:pimeloyl-ACP methyl ester carboxylesterase